MSNSNEISETPNHKVGARWTPRLAQKFCPISSVFLENHHRLLPYPGAKPITPTQVLLLVHLFDFKWDGRAPYPTVGTLAKRLGVSDRQVRSAMKDLEERGLVQREAAQYSGPNRYVLDGLFQALERLMDEGPANTTTREVV